MVRHRRHDDRADRGMSSPVHSAERRFLVARLEVRALRLGQRVRPLALRRTVGRWPIPG